MTPTFYELVDQAIALLREHARLSYWALKRQFDLDDGGLEDLKFELIEVHGVAADRDGAVLVWRARPRRRRDRPILGPLDRVGWRRGPPRPSRRPRRRHRW